MLPNYKFITLIGKIYYEKNFTIQNFMENFKNHSNFQTDDYSKKIKIFKRNKNV